MAEIGIDGLNISWRGQPRSGKKQKLHSALKKVADLRGIPFNIQIRQFHTQGISKSETGQISTTAADDGDDGGGSEKDCFPYEFSHVHIGFDIARMSMQDKIYLKPILQRWSVGSQVLSGNQGRGSRILVFYHAHLFSTESCFLLHSLLEENYGDMSIWVTSELPIPIRLSDYFIEIPVAFIPPQLSRDKMDATWHQVFEQRLRKWSLLPKPKLNETMDIRAFLYELLMRNLRWTDCINYLLDVVLTFPFDSEEKRHNILSILAKQEATGAGMTIPSYRIPLLWEALFLDIREVISCTDVDVLAREREKSKEKERVAAAALDLGLGGEVAARNTLVKVDETKTKSRRSTGDAKRSSKSKPL
jgi:hypothetical protein